MHRSRDLGVIVDDKCLFKQLISSICRSNQSRLHTKNLKLESLELRRIYNDMVMVYNILHGPVNVSENKLISCNNHVINTTISTRGHGFKFKTTSFRLDIKNNIIEWCLPGTYYLNA